MRIALLLGSVLGIVRFAGCDPLLLLDTRATDFRLMQRGRQEPSPEVVIVAVDDASIASVGRWPWSRTTMATLLDRIDGAGPSVIGFDVVQSEATAPPDLESLRGHVDDESVEKVRRALATVGSEDAQLAAAVARSGKVVAGYFFEMDHAVPRASEPALGAYKSVQVQGSGERQIPKALGVVANLDIINKSARATGFFNTFPDPGDGYFRRVPMVIRYGDQLMLPLPVAMLSVLWPDRVTSVRIAPFGVEEIRIGKQDIPVAEDGQLLLNYRGPKLTFPHIPAAEVLAGRVDPARFKDKLVLVGVTATAVADIRATPLDGVFPGVEIQATALDNILRASFLRQPRWTVLLDVGAIFGMAVMLGLMLRWARGVSGALAALSMLAAYLVGSQWMFVTTGIPLGIVHPILAVVVVYATIAVYQYVVQEGQRRRAREAFSRYLNPEIARALSENPEMIRLGGERRELTVLFSDIRGFTSISERLEPEDLVELLNVYLGEMTEVIFEQSGTLDKYVGDAIMAVWGAPLPQPTHAALACEAALSMCRRLVERTQDWQAERGWPRIEAGIGLHTGDMVVGNMGSTQHLSYTVIGDNVNLASRLESLTKTYGVQVLVSADTLAAAGKDFLARELDIVAVKGRSAAVTIYELLGHVAERERWQELLDVFAEGVAAYRQRNFREAMATFGRVLDSHPDDRPSSMYVERCRAFLATPPPADWQGVTVMESK
ncbi:MAG TPA: adenylate/guanylate cyclase domain-containing protein [Candidatus Limnocylindrales bacterium]|nr:adenylate/guanylate cyclase domain-containing protein [Candidatus Limnocylindrales bacterium]